MEYWVFSDKLTKTAVVSENPDGMYEILILNDFFQSESDNKIKEFFYVDWGAVLGVSNRGGISAAPNPVKFEVKERKISFYGMARRGGVWKGAVLELN